MAYTNVSITAPSNAVANSRIDATINIKNNYSTSLLVLCAVMIDGIYFTRDNDVEYWIAPGVTQAFLGHFTMPNYNVILNAKSYWKATDGTYFLDAEKNKSISLTAGGWVELGSLTSLSIVLLAGGWKELGSLTSLSIVVLVGGWKELGSLTSLSIVALVGGWKELGSLTTLIVTIPGEPPPVECSIDSDCPEGYVCQDGICVKEVKASAFPWIPVALGVGAAVVAAAALTKKGGKQTAPTKSGKTKTGA